MTTTLTVTRGEMLTPDLRRLWFSSDDLSAFAESKFTDRYVKLVFLKDGVVYPEPLDVRALRGVLPPEDMPTVRTYTALFPDVSAGTLAIDFVLHGDDGVAGPWARAAVAGDTVLANGPGGAYRPDLSADWHLLVGDASALPAITAALAELPVESVVRLVLQVESSQHRPALVLGDNTEVTWVDREPDDDNALARAVAELSWPEGRVSAFVHGEAQAVMHGVRPYLLRERGLDRSQVSLSGYWRRGRSEEGFREWKSSLAEAEGETRGGGRKGGRRG